MKLCECGCGKLVKGKKSRFYVGHQNRGRKLTEKQIANLKASARRGRDNHAYNGGTWIEKRSGRCYIRCRDGSAVLYYRAVMEAHIKRELLPNEIVHHINGDQTDDRLENLQLVSWGDHSAFSNKKYCLEFMVACLRQYLKDHGKRPTMKRWNELRLLPNVKTYQARFGSWSNALREAGINV